MSEIVKVVQDFIGSCFEEDIDVLFEEEKKEKTVVNMFLILELLYEHYSENCDYLQEVRENVIYEKINLN